MTQIHSSFQNSVIAITGGTGSFGQHVLKFFLGVGVKEIRVFSRDEKKQDEMRSEYQNSRLKFYIGDVRTYSSVEQAFKGVDFVFHAAALKQVPSCEFYPLEAVRTNILGTENVLSAAITNGVKKVVVLSTDKAVYPINAMGQTKALMEKVLLARARLLGESETTLCITRYGNVMGSRGSVIPLFINQILERKPITVTDAEMTRFLMSLDESVNLVLYAFEHGGQGDIFVQKSPAATMGVVAQALKDLFDYGGPIRVIGTRHGEKLFESLVSREEMVRVEDLDDYYRIPADNRDLNYAMYVTEGLKSLSVSDDYTSHNTVRLDLEAVKQRLAALNFVQAGLQENTRRGSRKGNVPEKHS